MDVFSLSFRGEEFEVLNRLKEGVDIRGAGEREKGKGRSEATRYLKWYRFLLIRDLSIGFGYSFIKNKKRVFIV